MPNSASDIQVGGDHYKKYKIQPGYFCEVNRLDGYESAAIKYIVRHQDKGGVEDLNKAIHCLELIKEIKYPDKNMYCHNIKGICSKRCASYIIGDIPKCESDLFEFREERS